MGNHGWTSDVLEGHIDNTDSTDSTENISEAAKNCHIALGALLDAISDNKSDQVTQEIPTEKAVKKRDVEQLWERFEQWAGNLGAMQPRASPVSLEHRLRNSPAVKEAILGFLVNLCESTEAATEIFSGKRINRTASMLVDSDVDLAEYDISSSDSDSSLSASSTETQDPETLISEIHELMLAIKHAIDSLFKASDFIRKFAPSERRQRASKTAPFDSQADKMYLRDRYPAALRKNEPLVVRLGEANARRRQYFKYRRDHSARLATLPSEEIRFAKAPNPESRQISNHTKPIEGQAPGSSADKSAVSKVTKPTLFAETEATELVMGNLEAATTFLEPAPSVASFATSIVEHSDDPLSFPPLPQEALDTSSFICPYCYMVVAVKSSKDKNYQWRKHVINDLQPYICTFSTCSLDAFTSQHSWFEHELLKHRNNWRCQICHDPDAPAFETAEEIYRHITQSHSEVLEKQIADVVEQSRRPLQWIPANDCPLCDDDWASADVEGDRHVIVVDPDQFRKHLGHHLQQIALFSLPRAPPNEKAGSNEVMGLVPDQEDVPAAGYKWVREDCGRGWSIIAKKRSTFIAFSAFLKKLEETNRNVPAVDSKDKVSLLRTLYHPQSSPIYSVSISPDRRFLAVGYRTSVLIYDPANAQNHCILYYGPGDETIFGDKNTDATHYRCLCFTADSKYLITGGDEGKIMICNVREKQIEGNWYSGHIGGVSAISLASQDGMTLVSGGRDGEIHFWDLTSIGSNSLIDLRVSGAKVESIVVSPDFKLLAAGYAMGILSVWNLDGYKPLFTVIAHTLAVTAVAFTSSSLCLYSGSRDGTIQKWDAKESVAGEPHTRHLGTTKTQSLITAMSLVPETMYMMTSFVDGTIQMFDYLEDEIIMSIQAHPKRVSSFAIYESHWAPNFGGFDIEFVSGSSDGSIRMWSYIDESLDDSRRTRRGLPGENI